MSKFFWLFFLFLAPLVADGELPKIIIDSPAAAESTPGQYNVQDKITSMVFSLGAIIIAVMLVTFLFKKFARQRLSAANSSNAIKILEKRALNPKTFLYVIHTHNKTLLIGESPTGLVALGELSDETEKVPDGEPAPLSFTKILKKKFEEFKP